MKLNKIQLDALIVAKKYNSAYICDDLFMRRIADWAGIKNNNFTFLLPFILNSEYTEDITVELSKTNYIYTPLLTAGNKIQEVIQNLKIGKRKKQIYGATFDRIGLKENLDDNED